MPKIYEKTARKSKTEKKCGRCHTLIVPGMKYRYWSFRYGGTHYRCDKVECSPRPSELTQSKMSDVYAAIEDARPTIKGWGGGEGVVGDLQEALGSVVEAARQVAEEYRSAAEAMGGAGSENEERADNLDSFADDVESAKDNLEEFDEDEARKEIEAEHEGEELGEEDMESELTDRQYSWADDQKNEALGVLDDFSL